MEAFQAKSTSARAEYLEVLNSLIGKKYVIPVQKDGYIRAADLASDKAPTSQSSGTQIPRSFRILDNGLQHTACMEL